MNKVVSSIKEAAKLCGITDGMTISFHHNLRGGDTIAGQILTEISALGIKDLTIAPSSLLPGHDTIIPFIQDHTISHIQTSGVSPSIGRILQYESPLCNPIEMRTHGSRCAALQSGAIKIDIAFIAVPSADSRGNCNALSGRSAFGSLGYSMMDAKYASRVIVITDGLTEFPVFPISIDQSYVDYVVPVESIGDPAGIATASLQPSKSPLDMKIANLTAHLVCASGHLKNGCGMQTGAGKISLSVVVQLEEYMEKNGIVASFAMGGINTGLVNMLNKGLIKVLYDVQSFDIGAINSIAHNPAHVEVSADAYAGPNAKGGAIVNDLDFTILGATEIDTDFNVNVISDSNNQLISGTGGHGDSAAGAKLSIITAPLYRLKYPTVVTRVNTICTPGDYIDAFVCEKGIAINTASAKKDNLTLAENLKAAGIPVMSIFELQKEAEKYTGKLPPLQAGSKVIANVLWRDGTVIDRITAF